MNLAIGGRRPARAPARRSGSQNLPGLDIGTPWQARQMRDRPSASHHHHHHPVVPAGRLRLQGTRPAGRIV